MVSTRGGAEQVGEGAVLEPQGAPAQANGDDSTTKAHKDYKATLNGRNARIAKLEGEIAKAAKTAEGTEKPRAKMNEPLRRTRRLRAPAHRRVQRQGSQRAPARPRQQHRKS